MSGCFVHSCFVLRIFTLKLLPRNFTFKEECHAQSCIVCWVQGEGGRSPVWQAWSLPLDHWDHPCCHPMRSAAAAPLCGHRTTTYGARCHQVQAPAFQHIGGSRLGGAGCSNEAGWAGLAFHPRLPAVAATARSLPKCIDVFDRHVHGRPPAGGGDRIVNHQSVLRESVLTALYSP